MLRANSTLMWVPTPLKALAELANCLLVLRAVGKLTAVGGQAYSTD